MVCFIYGFCAGVCATLNCGRIFFFKANKDYANNNVLMIMRLACQFSTNYEKLICLVKLFAYSEESIMLLNYAVYAITPQQHIGTSLVSSRASNGNGTGANMCEGCQLAG